MAEILEREFVYDKKILPDPDPLMPPSKVKEVYSAEFPELATANITGPEIRNNKSIYKFSKSYKPKG